MSHQLPHPHAKQREFMRSRKRFMALVWGRRSGKSLGIALYTMLKAIETQGNYYIIAPTYKQAKSIYWQDILKVLIPGAIVKKTDEGELYIQFKQVHYDLQTTPLLGYDINVTHDPNLPPSTIYLKGADNPDSLRGVSLRGAVLDEFAFFKEGGDTWRKIVRPALGDKQGWAIFSSTPDGVHNPFYDIVELARNQFAAGGNWFYSHATALDNPHFPKEEWAETKHEYEVEGKIDEWAQEWEALFTTPSTLVYNEFSEAHIVHPSAVPREGTNALAMDFGLKDPFACVFVKIDYDNNWYIYDEIYQPDLPVDKIARVVHEKMGDNHFTRMIGDSAGATEMASLRSKALGSDRLWVTPSKKGKDSIRGGIRQMKTHLYVREHTGKPKMFVSSNCRALIREFQSYKYMRDAWGELSDRPEDKNNHLLDALRYLVIDHMEGSKPIPKAQHIYDPNTGRLLS